MLTHLAATPIHPARVVVIGAGGFIGNAVVGRLERDGVTVLRLGRNEVDLLDLAAADRLTTLLRDGDAVVAASAIAPCKTSAMLKDNITLALAIVTALARVSLAHVINISSDAVYGDSSEPMVEASPTAPGSLHGVMHLARELIFQAEIKVPLAILRPTLVYGARDPHNGYGPNKFRRQANRGEDIVLFGEGEERRDHVLVDDLAELVARMLYARSVGVLNGVTGAVASFREIAEAAVAAVPRSVTAAAAARSVAILGSPRNGPMPHNGYRAFDPAATRAAFPDFVYTPLAEGLRRAQAEEFAHG